MLTTNKYHQVKRAKRYLSMEVALYGIALTLACNVLAYSLIRTPERSALVKAMRTATPKV